MAEADKAHYEREMKSYIPPKGEQKRSSRVPRRPFSCFVLSKVQKSKDSILAGPLVMLPRSWARCGVTAADGKQPDQKMAKLKENTKRRSLPTKLKGSLRQQRGGLLRLKKKKKTRQKKKKEEEDEEDDE